jgi:hypothetical protein
MALATTTLSSAVGVNDVSIVVASATSVAAGRFVLVDQEVMKVTQGYVSGTTVPVLRGQDGSVTAAHKVTSNVTHGTAADFANPSAQTNTTYPTQRAKIVTSLTATSTLALPAAGSDLVVILNGTSVIALTVPVPTKDMDSTELTIVSNGAAAHTLTFTGGLSGAGSNYDVITVNATAPAAFKFIACNGLWLAFVGPAMGGTVIIVF